MKTRLYHRSFRLLLLILLATACRKENNIPSTSQSQTNSQQQTLSKQEVTDWYQHQDTAKLQTNGLQTFSLKKLTPDLSKLESIHTKKGNFWLVHLPGTPKFQNVAMGYRKLAFQKDSTGQIQARILEIIPDGLYLQRKQKAETKDFTGRVFIYDRQYHLTGGFLYSRGEIIGKIKPVNNDSQTQNLQINQLRTNTYAVVETCSWYQTGFIDGEGIITIYAENICTYGIYDDGMGGGGGGGDYGSPAGGGGDYLGGGGGGGGDASGAHTASNLPGQDNPKINPKNYMDCFAGITGMDIKLQVTVFVQEPFPGTSFNYGPNSVGHTAISLTKSGGGQTVTQTVGFYPDASGKAKMNAPGKLVDNGKLEFNASITYNVDASQWANLINYLNSPLPTYDISELNCTGYVYNACTYAGINLPNPYATVGLPLPDGTWPQAMTPAGLGNSIDQMQGQPGVNTNGGSVPDSHGPCN